MGRLDRLRGVFGRDFVSYVLSLPLEGGESELSAAQSEVADILVQILDGEAKSEVTDPDPSFWIGKLAAYDPESGLSLFGNMRQYSGGEVPVVESIGDEFCDLILVLARDCLPLLLLKADEVLPFRYPLHLATSLYRHPKLGAVVAAFKSDSSLSKFFPFPGPENSQWENSPFPGMGEVSYAITSRGGGTLQLSVMIPQIVSVAAVRCLMAGGGVSWETLRENVIRVVSELRDLADRKTVSVPTHIGLAGISLPAGTVLDLPDGRIRPAVETDRDLFPRDVSASAVYETSQDLVLYDVVPNVFDDDPAAVDRKYDERRMAAYRDFTRSIDLMRLAILLASPATEPSSVREVCRYTSDNLSPGTQSWDPSGAWLGARELPESSFANVREWAQLVTKKHVPSMNIGMRRVLSAATSRTDPIDAFVDAVICWESLFGVNTETSFRVTGAIAKLTEPSDPLARDEKLRELKRLYGARSRLVHGGEEPKAVDIEAYRKKAIVVAADCLRRLYGERSDLLDLPSDLRGARIMLE